jgi:hypothetical protein
VAVTGDDGPQTEHILFDLHRKDMIRERESGGQEIGLENAAMTAISNRALVHLASRLCFFWDPVMLITNAIEIFRR